jgi:hypothetical protein
MVEQEVTEEFILTLQEKGWVEGTSYATHTERWFSKI